MRDNQSTDGPSRSLTLIYLREGDEEAAISTGSQASAGRAQLQAWGALEVHNTAQEGLDDYW